jgi:hypothetical protein
LEIKGVDMPNIALKILIIVVAIIFPPLFLGYMNWDISYIATIGSWDSSDRSNYAFFSLVLIVASVAFSREIIESIKGKK